MKTVLHPLQENRAAFLAARFHAACRGEPGVGKTLIALRAAEMVKAKTGLVICPAHIRRQWQKVIAHELGADFAKDWHVISYNEAIRRIGGYQNCVTGYGNRLTMGRLMFPKYDVCILDESHFLKSLTSARTQACFGPLGLARRARYKWALSGTMTPNGRPVELFPMIKALCPKFNIPFATFGQRYCGAYFDGRGICYNGATNLEELTNKLRDFMCHLTLEDLEPGRAEPVVERVPLDLTAEDLKLIHAEEDIIGGRQTTLSSRYDEFCQLGDTSHLLRLLSNAKFRSAEEFITNTLGAHDKVVVFCRHVDLIEKFQMWYQGRSYNPVVRRGGMSEEMVETIKHKFINDPKCRLLIAQEDAAGTGLDGLQTACSIAIDVEPSWTPGVTEQKMHRLNRIGQVGKTTTFYMLYADGTLDEVKSQVHTRKQRNVDKMQREDTLMDFLK